MRHENPSTFRHLANLVRVHDILSESASINISMTLEEASQIAMECDWDPMDHELVVFSGSEPVGSVWFEDLVARPGKRSLRKLMTPITPTRILPAEATYFEAVRAFRARKYHSFIVIDGSGVAGVLALSHLLRPPGRMCLFALTLELEELAQSICISRGLFDKLPGQRQAKAHEVFRMRQQESSKTQPAERDLVASTTFIDKGTMLGKASSEVLPDWNSRELKSLFHKAETVRNACAHPIDEAYFMWGILKGQIGEFVECCERLIEALQQKLLNG